MRYVRVEYACYHPIFNHYLCAPANAREGGIKAKAAEMTLFTTAKLTWLLKYWQRMFPKAPAPMPIRKPAEVDQGSTPVANKKGVPALIDLIAGPEEVLSSDVIEKLTGIPSTKLSERLKLPKVQAAMTTCGRIYEAGKGRSLSRIVRLVTPLSQRETSLEKEG